MAQKQAQNLRRWIEALRSGEYPQARHQLKSSYGYCCLGVAVCILEGDGAFKQDSLDASMWYVETDTDESLNGRDYSALPRRLADAFGLNPGDDDQAKLIHMNDGYASFSEIAKHIEEEILPRVEAAPDAD